MLGKTGGERRGGRTEVSWKQSGLARVLKVASKKTARRAKNQIARERDPKPIDRGGQWKNYRRQQKVDSARVWVGSAAWSSWEKNPAQREQKELWGSSFNWKGGSRRRGPKKSEIELLGLAGFYQWEGSTPGD